LNDIVSGVKNMFASSKQLLITSQISLAPNGDMNKNGQIDSGDTIKFTYIIINPTSDVYNFYTFKTNIDTKDLNSINNVQGVFGLDDRNNTVTFPNFTIQPNQVRKVNFDARINFDKISDHAISTQPVFVDQNNSKIIDDSKHEVHAHKMDEETFNKFVHITQQ
jgi:hypothetical protein